MKRLLLLFYFILTTLAALFSQTPEVTFFYESVDGNSGAMDTVHVYLRSTSSHTVSIRTVNVSFAYRGQCSNYGGSFHSLFTTELGAIFEGILNANPLPANPPHPVYDGQTYNARFSYANGGFTPTDTISVPGSASNMLRVFSIPFSGNCVSGVYMEDQAENPLNQIGNPTSFPMPYNIVKLGGVPPNFPVEYAYFGVSKLSGSRALLQWETTLEVNNEHFLIEKSTDPSFDQFTVLTKMASMGATQSSPNQYSFLDDTEMGKQVFYRLRQVDADGEFSFSNVETLVFGEQLKLELQAFPNPVEDVFTFRIVNGNEKVYAYRLVDITGRILRSGNIFTGFGSDLKLDISTLTQGVYSLEISNNESGMATTKKIYKQ